MDDWASLLAQSPLIAMVIALGIVTVHLYRAKDALQKEKDAMQAQHTADLVAATQGLQNLTATTLEKAFTTQTQWADALRNLREQIRDGSV
jgi:negative regulator of sigma E activity